MLRSVRSCLPGSKPAGPSDRLRSSTFSSSSRSCTFSSRYWKQNDRLVHATYAADKGRSEEHTSELQSLAYLVCRLLLEKKKKNYISVACCSMIMTIFILFLDYIPAFHLSR